MASFTPIGVTLPMTASNFEITLVEWRTCGLGREGTGTGSRANSSAQAFSLTVAPHRTQIESGN